jgi:hypothetical protein
VSSWQIREMVFRLFAKWVLILGKKQIREGQNTSYDGMFIRKGLKRISQNCRGTFCRKLVLYMYCWFIGIPVFVRGGTQIFPEFESSSQTRYSSGFCH